MNTFLNFVIGVFAGWLLAAAVIGFSKYSQHLVIDSCKEYNMFATNSVVMRCEVVELKK